jgi:elongation factor Ts
MATITAQLVKELRDTSGAGMMDCKNALKETDGDMEAAIDWLRNKGLAKAAKKAGRVAAEGLVGVSVTDGSGAVIELNSETDFVARNEKFQALTSQIATIALEKDGDFDALNAADFPGAGETVKDHITTQIGNIGENLSLRRSGGLKVSKGVVAAYMHNAVAPGLGKIGVLVALESEGDTAKLETLGKQIAMHIAATNPLALDAADLDPVAVEKEKTFLIEQARESGRPENIIEKMIEGRMRKYFEEVCLLKQTFVIDGENSIEKAIENAQADVGGDIKLTGYIRLELGEGIEKEEDDFAAEVAAAASS